MDWKKKLAGAAKIEKTTFRLIDGYVFPDTLIRQGGYNPEDFPLSEPPNIEDLQKSLLKIKDLEEAEKALTLKALEKA